MSADTPGRYLEIRRPSHPTPTSAMGLQLPAAPSGYTRPQLRITTESRPQVIRPAAIRHPNLVNSAPLQLPPKWSYPVDEYAFNRNDRHEYPAGDTPECIKHHGPPVIIDLASPPVRTLDTTASSRRPDAQQKGHKRKLSDKFKNLFSALHIKREGPPSLPDHYIGVAAPSRPHRSPGTASFLVTRHLAPNPNRPLSVLSSSSSTMLSVASRPVFAEKQRISKFLFPLTTAVSHFSNPTTMSSSPASSAQRSASSSIVLERSPAGMRERLDLDDSVRIDATVRKARSLPDLRKASGFS